MQSQTNTTIITRFTLNLANLAKLLDLLLTYTIRSWLIWQSTNKHGQHKHTTKSKAKTKTTENYLTYKTKQNSRSNQLNQSYKSEKNTRHRKMQVWTRTGSRVRGQATRANHNNHTGNKEQSINKNKLQKNLI
jgi:hypothetical protein